MRGWWGGGGGGAVRLQLSTVGPTQWLVPGSWSGDNEAQLNVQIKGRQEEPGGSRTEVIPVYLRGDGCP